MSVLAMVAIWKFNCRNRVCASVTSAVGAFDIFPLTSCATLSLILLERDPDKENLGGGHLAFQQLHVLIMRSSMGRGSSISRSQKDYLHVSKWGMPLLPKTPKSRGIWLERTRGP